MTITLSKPVVHYNRVSEHMDYNNKSTEQIQRSVSTLRTQYTLVGVPEWAVAPTDEQFKLDGV